MFQRGTTVRPMDESQCKVDGCEAQVYVKKHALCQKHYARFNRYGDVTVNKKVKAVCSVDGCGRCVAANDLCDTHYRRMRRYGSVELPTRPTVCAVAGCDDIVVSDSLCALHYRRKLRGAADTRQCAQCGKDIPDRAHGRRKYCSQSCYNAAVSADQHENHRDIWLRRQYGISEDEYKSRLKEQRGRCNICGSKDQRGRSGSTYFQVDHDHKTGAVRGLLCAPCNSGLGSFGDDIKRLEKAIEYLRAHTS